MIGRRWSASAAADCGLRSRVSASRGDRMGTWRTSCADPGRTPEGIPILCSIRSTSSAVWRRSSRSPAPTAYAGGVFANRSRWRSRRPGPPPGATRETPAQESPSPDLRRQTARHSAPCPGTQRTPSSRPPRESHTRLVGRSTPRFRVLDRSPGVSGIQAGRPGAGGPLCGEFRGLSSRLDPAAVADVTPVEPRPEQQRRRIGRSTILSAGGAGHQWGFQHYSRRQGLSESHEHGAASVAANDLGVPRASSAMAQHADSS